MCSYRSRIDRREGRDRHQRLGRSLCSLRVNVDFNENTFIYILLICFVAETNTLSINSIKVLFNDYVDVQSGCVDRVALQQPVHLQTNLHWLC